MAREGRCPICDRLPPAQLLELDSIIGDPAAWPTTVWGIFNPPVGGLSVSYRRFGAQRMGREWLDTHGWPDIIDYYLRRHIRFDVAHVARDTGDLIAIGLLNQTAGSITRIPTAPTIDAGAFIRYFNAGIIMGEAAQRMLAETINRALDEGDIPDPKLVMKLADMGASFARTQASLMAKGLKFGQDENDDDAFRGGEDTLPGMAVKGTRTRIIDGERRVVRDRGRKDREGFNKRAREEGTEELG